MGGKTAEVNDAWETNTQVRVWEGGEAVGTNRRIAVGGKAIILIYLWAVKKTRPRREGVLRETGGN